ncbi:MAG: baseplate J/gp47 family protein [Anaerolineales bacterium]|nr:baseplate J/gp47 family protein [Anaerolineales bacterium]
MPLQLPNLDQRTYPDLVEEARRLIPIDAPDWTNHNPSDPGITLIELFAHLTELLLYRLNRIPEANQIAFLKLINGPDWPHDQDKKLSDEIRETVQKLRERNRAVTCQDFETLAKAAAPEEIARAHCVPRRNLEWGRIDQEKPSHISVIIVPASVAPQPQPGIDPPDKMKAYLEQRPQPADDLLNKAKAHLEQRRLLTTQVHVVGPRYVTLGIQLSLFLKPDGVKETVESEAKTALQLFFHPLVGGPDRNGWPLGRNVYVSEIYQLLDDLLGVDYLEKTGDTDELTTDDPTRLKKSDDKRKKELIGVELHANELVDLPAEKIHLTIRSQIRS